MITAADQGNGPGAVWAGPGNDGVAGSSDEAKALFQAAWERRPVNVARLGATDFPQHFEALPIVRIERPGADITSTRN
jgi:hypothetical protein